MLRLVALAVCGLVLVTSGGLSGCSPGPKPAPLVPFGDFEVGRSGGVAGIREVLRVRADGVALLITNEPAAGRLSRPAMERLRVLLESEEFRQEAATSAADRKPPTCTDMFSSSVSMGTLTMSVEDRCGQEKRPATPAFNEILSLTAAARKGQFAGPVGGDEPPLVGLRFERSRVGDKAGYVITVAEDGEATLTPEGQPSRRETLRTPDRDALRLLVARLVETPVRKCEARVYYRLTITGFPDASGTNCSYVDRYPEFNAVMKLLERALET